MQQLLALLEPGTTAIYLIAVVLGLYVHYLVAKKNGRTSAATFGDYWLVETPGLSIATLLTLATAAGAVIKSGMLAPLDTYSIIMLGFGKAFLFDAVIQAPPVESTKPSQAGFARLGALLVLVAASLLVGCPANMPRAPQGVLEQIEAAEIGAQRASASIVNLTCTKFLNQRCVEPGKFFDPDDGIKYQAQAQELRKQLRIAASIGAGQVGQCLGQARTAEQCLAAARQLLAELERKVLEAQAQSQGAKP